ncbi:MAG: rod-binding protein, partial [Candidatus Krumholzibacteriia bacterium]
MELPGNGGGLGQLENARFAAEQGRLRALAARGGSGGEDREGLERAAREFEGVFLNQLMQAMRRTVPENELFNSQGATKIYRQMHDQEIAKA